MHRTIYLSCKLCLLIGMCWLPGCTTRKHVKEALTPIQQQVDQIQAKVQTAEQTSTENRQSKEDSDRQLQRIEELSASTRQIAAENQAAAANAQAKLDATREQLDTTRAQVKSLSDELKAMTSENLALSVSKPPAAAAIVQVFYVTDRAGPSSPEPAQAFIGKRGKRVSYGLCNVSIPPGHKTGAIETPSILRFEFSSSPDKHMIALRPLFPQSHDEFFNVLSTRVANSKGHEAFVFVHGFNTSFEEAVLRTAELAYDLAPYDGAPILYSWPSHDGNVGWSPPMYYLDEQQVDWTYLHLRDFLAEVARRTGASVVNVIAHSMGARISAFALKDLAAANPGLKLFRNIVFAAPDIDAEVFKDIAQQIKGATTNFTLYASSTDEALTLSKAAHTFTRAGQAGKDLVIMPGVLETIDATGVDASLLGHSIGRPSILTDIVELLLGVPLPRVRIRPVTQPVGPHWQFSQ